MAPCVTLAVGTQGSCGTSEAKEEASTPTNRSVGAININII